MFGKEKNSTFLVYFLLTLTWMPLMFEREMSLGVETEVFDGSFERLLGTD
jgi:hypothetical protein